MEIICQHLWSIPDAGGAVECLWCFRSRKSGDPATDNARYIPLQDSAQDASEGRPL